MLYNPARMAQTITIDRPAVIDLSYLESSSFGERELLVRTIDILLDQLPEQSADLCRALATGDMVGLRLAAHSLKSATSMLGMQHVGESLRQIEASAAVGAGRTADLDALIEGVIAACALAVDELSAQRFRLVVTDY